MSANSINKSPALFPSSAAPLGAPIGKKSSASRLKSAFSTRTPAPVKVVTEQNITPLKKNTRSFFTGVKNAFSFNGFKSIGQKGALFGVGITGGALLAVFAGPQIHAIAIGLAASAAFPPVMIAIGATVGAALLAFGIYKFVQYTKKQLKKDELAQAALEQQQAGPTGFSESGYVAAPLDAPKAQEPAPKPASVKPASIKPSYAPSVAQASQKSSVSKASPAPAVPTPAPLYSENTDNVWGS